MTASGTPGGERVRDELAKLIASEELRPELVAAARDAVEFAWLKRLPVADALLAAVLPLLTAADVPHVERDLRARLAAVIGECDLADSRGHVTSFSRRVRRAAEGPGQ